ncbi:MAG TPA: helix-turn-helix transcriptional regulator [Candidatus Acidoferrales bacterium]|nr:helix-turn-helix transcriptional regulator [Candidatus Acidoferrales bacterium]
MIVGERLKQIRDSKNMSQGDIERRTGLLRCYISRVENGHTVPALETLEKMARAMEIPLYQIFYEGGEGEEPKMLNLPPRATSKLSRKDASLVSRLTVAISRMSDRDKALLAGMAQKLAAR